MERGSLFSEGGKSWECFQGTRGTVRSVLQKDAAGGSVVAEPRPDRRLADGCGGPAERRLWPVLWWRWRH